MNAKGTAAQDIAALSNELLYDIVPKDETEVVAVATTANPVIAVTETPIPTIQLEGQA